jgi:HK97 family phage portal protein
MAGLGLRVKAAARAAVGIFSEDAARQAYGMLGGIFQGGLGVPPNRGTAEYLQAYSKMPWLRAVTGRVSGRVASTEWTLFVSKKGDEKAQRNRFAQRAKAVTRRKILKQLADQGELKQIDDHPLLDMLHSANSFQTGDAMRKVTQLHIDLVGEAFWLKERDALGVPVAVWPIPPNWVLNTPTPAQPFYRVQFRGWRGWIPDTEMLWFSDPDPANPYYRGSGTVQSLGDELETDEYAAKHTKAYFFNRAKPDMLIYPKQGNMREPDVARLEEHWMSRNSGFWKAFKPYFLTREVGVHEFDQGDFRSMRLVELRQFERDTVLQTFGVPPEILGVLDNSNRSTITAADLVFSRYVIEPRLEFLRGVMQERLVPEYDDRLILDYISPVQDDKDFHLDVAKVAPFALNVDEWREMMGRGPMDDDRGLVHMVPNTMTAMDPDEKDGLVKPEPPPLPPGALPGVPGAKPPAEPKPAPKGSILNLW